MLGVTRQRTIKHVRMFLCFLPEKLPCHQLGYTMLSKIRCDYSVQTLEHGGLGYAREVVVGVKMGRITGSLVFDVFFPPSDVTRD